MNDAKDSGVGTDAKPNGKDNDHTKARSFQKASQRETEFMPHDALLTQSYSVACYSAGITGTSNENHALHRHK